MSSNAAAWAGQNGYHFLTGNIVTGESTDRFEDAQLGLLGTFRDQWAGPGAPRAALGRVILPVDGTDGITRRRYRDFAAGRQARTLAPQGTRRTLYAPDIVGLAGEIVDTLSRDRAVHEGDELPYSFARDDYGQILTDVIRLVPRAFGRRMPAHATRTAGGLVAV